MTIDLTGQLVYIFGVSILDGALLSLLALIWYRRSARGLMRVGAREPVTSAAVPSRPRPVSATLDPGGPQAFQLVEEQAKGPERPPVPGRGSQGRVILAYCLGAAAFAAVITSLKFMAASSPLPAVAWLADWWMNAWPIVPTLVALLVLERPLSVRLVLLYLGGGAVAIALFTAVGQLLRGTLDSAPLTNIFWAMLGLGWSASIPLLLIALTAWRRVRAAMPIALAATLLFGFGSMFFRELLIRALNIDAFRSIFLLGPVLLSQYVLFMLVSLPVGWIAWRLLTRLAEWFRQKRFSDVQLIIDCWWVVVAAEVTATTLSSPYGFAGIAGGVAALVAYRLAVLAVLHGSRPVETAPHRLLLLRVFGYQARTESLFDRVAQAWRFHGPVQLIAGADLAMRTADPGDLLALLSGRLAALFVTAPHEIRERLAHLDLLPDPDGRFRVNEVYCSEGTWRPMLAALLDSTDAVLMDLRSFSASNAGCIFELEQLIRRLPSDRIILVSDSTTDMPLLRRILGDAWTIGRLEGQARGAGRVSVVRMERQSRSEIGLLMRRLLEGPRPAGLPL